MAERRAGWLHDLGRVGVSASVWNHPGPLTPHQWEQVRLHPYYTDRVLDRTPFLRRVGAIASAHHEHVDGTGYFRAVRAVQLPMPARVLAAADAYHPMTEADQADDQHHDLSRWTTPPPCSAGPTSADGRTHSRRPPDKSTPGGMPSSTPPC